MSRPRYTLDELLAESDYSQPLPPEEREWVDAPAVGREWPAVSDCANGPMISARQRARSHACSDRVATPRSAIGTVSVAMLASLWCTRVLSIDEFRAEES